MRAQRDEKRDEMEMKMKCPKCGRFGLKETGQGVSCRVCGYTLSPGENDRFRLYKLLKEEEKGPKRR